MEPVQVILQTKGNDVNWIIEAIRIIVPALTAIGGAILGGVLSQRTTQKTIKAKNNEIEIQEIKEALKLFYNPVLLLIRKNKQLYDIFKLNKSEDFRTLVELLKGKQFNGNDRELLDKIIELDIQINILILGEKGRIIDEEISKLLAKASLHFSIMIMAKDGQLSGEVDRFKEYVYPKELESELEKEVKRLTTQLRRLEGNE